MSRPFPTLPIGLPKFSVREPDGVAELAIARGAAASLPRPMRVTGVLTAALKSIDGEEATAEVVRRLSSGTREWLLQKVASLFRPRDDWFQAACTTCGAQYDLTLDLGALPAKPEGQGFPTVTVDTTLGPRHFDVPNGTDEEALSADPAEEDPTRRLVGLCGLAEDAAAEATLLADADIDAIDEALDAAAPQPSDRSASRCPSCGHPTEAEIEPLAFAFPSEIALLRDVHQIAARYHWNEDAILSLPTRRRRQYLALIRSDGRQHRAERLS
jgi:hypothetical protein